MKRSLKVVLLILLLFVFGFGIYYSAKYIKFSLSSFILLAFEALTIIILWRKSYKFRGLIGENRRNKRTNIHQSFIYYLLLFLILPFCLFFLVGQLYQPLPLIAQFGLIGTCSTLGGLVLTASRMGTDPNARSELVRVSQKFIFATLLFITLAPILFMIDHMLNGIDLSFSLSNLKDLMNWYRGILFWFAVPCFFGGILLFIVGLIDLAFELSDLKSEDDGKQSVTFIVPKSSQANVRPLRKNRSTHE